MDRVKRKVDHIDNALTQSVLDTRSFDDVKFVHQSLSNIGLEDIDLSTEIGELSVSSPIFVNAMTGGGGQRTIEINRCLARVASKYKMAVAVGSQMAAIKDKDQANSYKVVREENPNGLVIGNLGSEATVDQAKAAVDMLEANALQIHLNVVQELVMPEGDRDFTNAAKRIEAIVNKVGVPVIVKEVGYGISKEAASILAEIGITIIDIGGYGGTNFSKIENLRRKHELSMFDNWGIATAASICEVKNSYPNLTVIGSGGINNGLDVAKSLALGSSAVGIAGLFLRSLHEDGEPGLMNKVEIIHNELKYVMTALGIRKISEFNHAPLVISGETFHWLDQRGIETKKYAQRR